MMNATNTLESLLKFANTKKLEIDKKRENFNKKTPVGLWWDSKIPEKDTRIFNLISFFQISDKEEVDKNILPFLELYNSICELESLQNAPYNDEVLRKAYDKVNDLYKMLEEMSDESKVKLNATSSSCIYHLCKDLLRSKGLLDEKLVNFKVCLQRLRMKNLSSRFNEASNMCEQNNRNRDALLKLREELERKHDEIMMKINQFSSPRP